MPSRDFDGDHSTRSLHTAEQGAEAQKWGCFVGPGVLTDGAAVPTVLAAPESVRCTPEEVAKMQAVGQLAGSAAHDFNNIFTAVLGNLQLIQRRTTDDSRLREMVAAGVEASMRGKDLANRLLAFSQRQQLELRVVDANAQLLGMENTLRRTAGRRIDICIRLSDDAWTVETDPVLLEAAIVNLTLNAREAMQDGGTLNIETANVPSTEASASSRPSTGRGSYVRIAVRDSGCGMAPDLLGRIFEPFFTTKPTRSHAGLGLNMVAAFVEQCRGQLTVGSVPGEGTCFNIFLPVAATTSSPLDGQGRGNRNPSEFV